MRAWLDWDTLKQTIDYDWLLPLISRWPLAIGQRIAQLRGWVHGLTDYDWRSCALKKRYVRKTTFQAMQALKPDASKSQQALYTVRRFVHNSREEWESCLFRDEQRIQSILKNSQIEGLEGLLQAQQQGRGVVLLTCHFDSFCMGIVLLGRSGLRVNAITTSILEDSRVSVPVQTFFQNKIEGMEKHMRGGKLKYSETSLSYFYKALRKGEVLVIQADLQAPPDADAITVPFLGGMRRMSAGASRMAVKTDSLVAAYMCQHQGVGQYKVTCRQPEEINKANPEQTFIPFYQFLEGYIQQHPDRWLAADHFPTYQNIV